MDLQPGIYAITNEQYHREKPYRDALSSTFLKNLIQKSPGHAIYEINHPAEKPEFDFGTAFHTILLEPNKFQESVTTFNGRRYGKKWDEFQAEAGDKLILKPDDLDRLTAMRDSVMSMTTAKGLFSDGVAEQSYFWVDEMSGLMCRCRPDWENTAVGVLADVKTTSALASKSSFSRTIANFHYDLQAAFYKGGVNILSESSYSTWIWVVVETQPPHGVGIYEADIAMMDNGRTKARHALDLAADCFKNDSWPMYLDEVVPVSLPNYALWWQKENE